MIMCIHHQLWQTKAFWSLFKAKKNIDADSDDENETNNAAPVPTSSEMRNIMESMLNCLDAHSNGKMSSKIEDIDQFVDNSMLKRTM
ncbi:hypothetical protein TNCV_2400591 [Trichonephila clavipes]|nr:hypothetical protein TNCV_2400591 [Trichonephila clavipes]